MSKALASLTAQYTDSENEGEAENKTPDESSNSQTSQVIIPKQPSPKASTQKTPETKNKESSKKKGRKRKKSVRRLVSYQDDTVISDDEGDDDSDSTDDSETGSETASETDDASVHNIPTNASRENSNSIQIVHDDDLVEIISDKSPKKVEKPNKYAHYGFSLPSEPKGKPSAELVDKIKQLYEKMETTNMDMNVVIQGRKEFRNPSIYEKLIQYCDINEFGTNYPPEIYDPLQWGQESYYEELARIQKNEMLKRQKERKDTDKIEQATALARKVEEEAKKRKSKWDQPAAATAAKTVPPTLTTTVTGTKGTVISAFGSLPKKPAA